MKVVGEGWGTEGDGGGGGGAWGGVRSGLSFQSTGTTLANHFYLSLLFGVGRKEQTKSRQNLNVSSRRFEPSV